MLKQYIERWFSIPIFTLFSNATIRSPDISLYEGTHENGFELISELLHCIASELGIDETLIPNLD